MDPVDGKIEKEIRVGELEYYDVDVNGKKTVLKLDAKAAKAYPGAKKRAAGTPSVQQADVKKQPAAVHNKSRSTSADK